MCPVEFHRRFGGTYGLLLQGCREIHETGKTQGAPRLDGGLLGFLFDIEHGGSTFLRNVGILLSDYMASLSRKYYSL
jgi:hypothetical protein